MAIEIERGRDGRWVAEVRDMPGVVAYGATAEDARRAALVMALRVVAERIERGESVQDALLAAIGAMQDALEHGSASTGARVLGAVLRIGSELKRRSDARRALPPERGDPKR